MSKKVYPTKRQQDARGHDNRAFMAPVDETEQSGQAPKAVKFEDVLRMQKRAKDWREYVTQMRRERTQRNDSGLRSGKTSRQQSVMDSHLGLEIDAALLREELAFKPSMQNNGVSVSPRDSKRNVTRLNRKLIEHFVMVSKQPPETAEVDLELVGSLLDNGADINCTDRYGQTILHETARLWHTDIALFLIQRGVDVNKSDRYGRSPLHVAAATNYPDMIELLLENGAVLEEQTAGEKQTPLHFAARNDAVEACKILIKCGADMEAEDYKKRTPVYVAADLDRSETARWLMENGADVGRFDNAGQSCMTNMIIRMGPVAMDALDTFHKMDRPSRKQYFSLHLLEPNLSDESETEGIDMKDPGGSTLAKTPLQVIVGYKQLDIIMHPVILKMLNVKWHHFGRFGAIRALLVNLLYILIWTALAVGVPWQTRYLYVLPGSDAWRIVFWIFAIASSLYFVGIEVLEIRVSRQRFALWKEWRIKSIESDKKFCHPKWPEEKNYLEREIENLDDMVPAYFHDFWNFFDWTVYFLNFFVFLTHIVNIVAYTPENRPPPCCTADGCDAAAQLVLQGNETDKSVCAIPDAYVNNGCLSVWVNRIFAINIIMMWLRLMKNIRAFRQLGPFVVMLGKITYDVLRFLFLYFEFYIPYACAFWMIFGNEPTIVSMSSVDQMLFSLYRITLVDDYEYDQMHTFDVVMTYILVGTFLGISAILCINLFIALLSDTFQRVYDNAQANAVMQQAILILSIEENLSQKRKDRFRRFIMDKCSPKVEFYDDDLTTNQDQDLKKATIQVRDQMDEVLEYIRKENEEREALEKHVEGGFHGSERGLSLRKRSYVAEADQVDGRFGHKSSVTSKELRMPGAYARITHDTLAAINRNQKANDGTMKKMQRDLREIKQLLAQLTPHGGVRVARKQQSSNLEVQQHLPPISDYHQQSPDSRSDSRHPDINQLMRHSSAGREASKAQDSRPSQKASKKRSTPSDVDMMILPGTSIIPQSGTQEDSFLDQPGLPSMPFPSVSLQDSDMGSSNV